MLCFDGPRSMEGVVTVVLVFTTRRTCTTNLHSDIVSINYSGFSSEDSSGNEGSSS